MLHTTQFPYPQIWDNGVLVGVGAPSLYTGVICSMASFIKECVYVGMKSQATGTEQRVATAARKTT